jgi:hypothetical protein
VILSGEHRLPACPFRQLAGNIFRHSRLEGFATLSVSSAGLPTAARWQRALARSPLADLVEVRGRFALNHPDVAHF